MTTRANAASRRSRNAKSLSVQRTQDCDSESETAVTSTSGQKVADLPAAKTGTRKRASRSPGVSRSRGTSRSPGVSESPAVSESAVSASPVVVKSSVLSKSLEVARFPEASKSPVAVKSPVALKSPIALKPPMAVKSPVAPKSPTESREATGLRVALKTPSISKQPSPSKKRRCLATVVKEEPVEEADVARKRPTEDQSSGNHRLLMREWLLKEVELDRIPGLGWLDRERRLIRIPWIHASKDGWSQDSHCKIFENWAIYTGKYDARKQKPDPKRWKANFRCALNSLGDIKEEPGMSKKNGTDGYRVYRVEDAVDRKGHRRHKMLNYTPAVESQTHSSVEPAGRFITEIISDHEEPNHQPEKLLDPCRTSSTPTTMTSSSTAYMQDFTDSLGQPILMLSQPTVVIACSTEFIRDTVRPGDGCYTSLSNMVVANDNALEYAVAMGDQETVTSVETVSGGRNCSTVKRDIVSLRNLDHNYFKVQIPTTVENFVDDDGSPAAEQHPKIQRKNTLR